MDIDQGRRQFIAGATVLAGAAMVSPSAKVLAQGTSKKLTDITIINSAANAQLALQELLKRQGYLEQMGLNATTANVADGSKVTAALLSGSADVCMISGFGQILPAVERGGELKVIAGANMLTPQGVLTNSANIKSIADLKGKKIGAGPLGALEQQLMVAMFMKHNVDPDSVTYVNIGSTPDIYRAISAGVVDAGPVNIDVYNQLKGDLHIIADFWTDLADFPYQGAFTSTDIIKNKRDLIVRALAAYGKLYRFLLTPESKDPYVQAYIAALGGSASAADAERQWQFTYDNKAFAGNLVIPDKSFDFIQELNLKTKAQQTKMPTDKFADMSLAQEAVKLMSQG